jgi:hypothetical protein
MCQQTCITTSGYNLFNHRKEPSKSVFWRGHWNKSNRKKTNLCMVSKYWGIHLLPSQNRKQVLKFVNLGEPEPDIILGVLAKAKWIWFKRPNIPILSNGVYSQNSNKISISNQEVYRRRKKRRTLLIKIGGIATSLRVPRTRNFICLPREVYGCLIIWEPIHCLVGFILKRPQMSKYNLVF